MPEAMLQGRGHDGEFARENDSGKRFGQQGQNAPCASQQGFSNCTGPAVLVTVTDTSGKPRFRIQKETRGITTGLSKWESGGARVRSNCSRTVRRPVSRISSRRSRLAGGQTTRGPRNNLGGHFRRVALGATGHQQAGCQAKPNSPTALQAHHSHLGEEQGPTANFRQAACIGSRRADRS